MMNGLRGGSVQTLPVSIHAAMRVLAWSMVLAVLGLAQGALAAEPPLIYKNLEKVAWILCVYTLSILVQVMAAPEEKQLRKGPQRSRKEMTRGGHFFPEDQ